MRMMNVACFTFAMLCAAGASAQDSWNYNSVIANGGYPAYAAPTSAYGYAGHAPTAVYGYAGYAAGAPAANQMQKGGCCDPRPRAFGLWNGFCNQGCGYAGCGYGSKLRGHRWVSGSCGCGACQKAPAYGHSQKGAGYCRPSFQLPRLGLFNGSCGGAKGCGGCQMAACRPGLFGFLRSAFSCNSCGVKGGCDGCKGGKSAMPHSAKPPVPAGGETWMEGGEIRIYGGESVTEDSQLLNSITPPAQQQLLENEARRLHLPLGLN